MKQSTTISRLNKLEKELNLKELQIKNLLNITQAINSNVSSEGLYNMYKNFLSWEMSVEKMVLFISKDGEWDCVSTIDVNYKLKSDELIEWMLAHKRLHTITERDPVLIRDFNIVIPVHHKDVPIAYAFIGGFNEEENLYSKVQFITTITNIIAVAIENKRLFNTRIEQERYKREMELASEVQNWLLPQSFPDNDRYDVEFFYQPHYDVGGDYFDFFPIDERDFFYCIADISGKGVGAAILMANFQAILKSKLKRSDRDLIELVRGLNRTVHNITLSDKFITFFIAHVNLNENTIEYINAGHNPPLFCYNDAIDKLDIGTTVLGAESKLPFVEMGRKKIDYDTLILNYTDGLIDLQNEEGEYFSIEHVKNTIQLCGDRSCKSFMKTLKKSLEKFKGKNSYSDDIAVLSFKIFRDSKETIEISHTPIYEKQ